jgi:hypothetical protein
MGIDSCSMYLLLAFNGQPSEELESIAIFTTEKSMDSKT